MSASHFERFYDDVRSGVAPELQQCFWVWGGRADGSLRPPTKRELREQLGGPDFEGGPLWREFAEAVLASRRRAQEELTRGRV